MNTLAEKCTENIPKIVLSDKKKREHFENLFSKELNILENGELLLKDEDANLKQYREAYKKLLKDYKKLTNNLKRAIRTNDLSEHNLTSLNGKLEKLTTNISKYIPRQIFESIYPGDKAAQIALAEKIGYKYIKKTKGIELK